MLALIHSDLRRHGDWSVPIIFPEWHLTTELYSTGKWREKEKKNLLLVLSIPRFFRENDVCFFSLLLLINYLSID